MTGRDIPQFGRPVPGRDHKPRPGAYGVVFDTEGRLLVVEEFARLYLPGGGLDPGETPEQALHREFAEETGYTAAIESLIGEAREFVADETPGVSAAFNKHCYLYAVRLTGAPACRRSTATGRAGSRSRKRWRCSTTRRTAGRCGWR